MTDSDRREIAVARDQNRRLLRRDGLAARGLEDLANLSQWSGPKTKLPNTDRAAQSLFREPPPLLVVRFSPKEAVQSQQRWAEYLGTPVVMTNSIGLKSALIPPGEFVMGATPEEIGELLKAFPCLVLWEREQPQHRVRITRPYYLGVTPVTQEQYQRLIGQNPSAFKGQQHRPVEQVSLQDAVEFCRKLSEHEGQLYRLPTEAEWEYACRADSKAKWCFGDHEAVLKEYAWYMSDSTHPTAQRKSNVWGLYDMHGNVWEWCADWYAHDYYATSPVDDPQGPASGASRVVRGGSWDCGPVESRSARRSQNLPGAPFAHLGFRVASNSPDASGR